jgi:hypothetical protein
MRYQWLANYLVQEWFPRLDKGVRKQLVTEAVCRAWCTFRDLDYHLMKSCVHAAAQRKGLVPPKTARSAISHPLKHAQSRPETLRRATVLQLSDYR